MVRFKTLFLNASKSRWASSPGNLLFVFSKFEFKYDPRLEFEPSKLLVAHNPDTDGLIELILIRLHSKPDMGYKGPYLTHTGSGIPSSAPNMSDLRGSFGP